MKLPIYNCYHPILRKKSTAVTGFDEKLKNFTNNMLETMYGADGIGLAANQVGDPRSIFIVDEFSGDISKRSPIIFINPKISLFSDETSDYKEGCLSIPKFYEYVTRPELIQIEYQDLNGVTHKMEFGDLLARVIQHEFDHLNGVLFFDKISSIKKTFAQNKLRKIEKDKFTIHYDMLNRNGEYIKASD
ncbi:peptide deformylase [Candidatus Kapabacteria bacterium]|nr:peptide deformylase [Candidatus Kapabacteria bacterium]